MFQLTCLGWLLFRSDSLTAFAGMIVEPFRGFHVTDNGLVARLVMLASPLVIVQ